MPAEILLLIKDAFYIKQVKYSTQFTIFSTDIKIANLNLKK